MTGWRWLLRRLLLMVPTFIGITLVTFLVVNVAGDVLDPDADISDGRVRRAVARSERVELREMLRLDLPLLVNPDAGFPGILTETRYGCWLGRVLRFDFGRSLVSRRPVGELIGDRLPVTLLMQGSALLLMLLIAVPLGVWSGVTRRRRLDRGVTLGLFALYALPAFWVATLCVLALGDVLPVQGFMTGDIEMRLKRGELGWWSWEVVSDVAAHLLVPVLVLAYGGLAVLARYARAGVREGMGRDFVRTARAIGLSEARVVRRHAARYGLVPLITLLGGLAPALVAGSIVVESVFGIAGIGLLTLDAATHCDVPVAMGVVTIVALFTLGGYLLADVVTAWVDPRVRTDA